MVRLLVSKVSARSSARCLPLPCNSRMMANRRSVLFIQALFLFSCPRTRDLKTPVAAIIAQTDKHQAETGNKCLLEGKGFLHEHKSHSPIDELRFRK